MVPVLFDVGAGAPAPRYAFLLSVMKIRLLFGMLVEVDCDSAAEAKFVMYGQLSLTTNRSL